MDTISPIPINIIIKDIIGIIAKGIVIKWNGELVTIITPTNNKMEMIKVNPSEAITPKMNICFGAAIFFNIFLFPFIATIDAPTEALKKERTHRPDKR